MDHQGARSADRARTKDQDHTAHAIEELRQAGERMSTVGVPESQYFLTIGPEDVRNLRDTKAHLSLRLDQADDRVQLVTVQGRGSKLNRAYAVVDVERLTALMTKVVEAERQAFVPVSDYICEALDGVVLEPVQVADLRGRRRARPASLRAVAKHALTGSNG